MRTTNNSAASALSGTFAPGEITLKIKELVGDPDAVVKKKEKAKASKHRYYKKPGKGHNRDNCDACGDTGGIICCDSCPASFHLVCLDPPLKEEQLPNGGWKCRACSMQKSRTNAKGILPKTEKYFAEIEKPELETRQLFGFFKRQGDRFRRQNPKMFTLPTTIPAYEPKLPGYSKSLPPVTKKAKTKKNSTGSFSIQPAPKPLPPKTIVCYLCGKSKRKGVLLKCDYCPAHFHLDCLDPPLNSIPSVYWICPLHPQPLMESKYLSSSVLSERMRIWDLVDTKVSPTFTALVNFATAVHCKIPKKDNLPRLPDKPKVNALPIIDEIYEKFRNNQSNQSKRLENQNEPSTSKGLKRKHSVPESTSASALNDNDKTEMANLPVKTLGAKTEGGENTKGVDLLLQAADLTEEHSLDKYLEGINPHLLKLLAVCKLADNGNITIKHQMQVDMANQIQKQLSKSIVTEGDPEPLPKKKRLEPTLALVYLNAGQLLEFHRRSIEVGTGGTATLDLATLGHCTTTSRRQAVIYYNSINCHWEMLNYGDRGSIVNGILYGCDTSVYNSGAPRDETLKAFKKIVDNRRSKLLELKDTFQSTRAKKENNCACLAEIEHPVSCWEGSAVLKKGDKLQFGCHKFVITDVGVKEQDVANGDLELEVIDENEIDVEQVQDILETTPMETEG